MTTKFTDEKEVCDFINDCKLFAISFNEIEKEVLNDIDKMQTEAMQPKPRQKVIRQLANIRKHLSGVRHQVSNMSNDARAILDKYNVFVEDKA